MNAYDSACTIKPPRPTAVYLQFSQQRGKRRPGHKDPGRLGPTGFLGFCPSSGPPCLVCTRGSVGSVHPSHERTLFQSCAGRIRWEAANPGHKAAQPLLSCTPLWQRLQRRGCLCRSAPPLRPPPRTSSLTTACPFWERGGRAASVLSKPGWRRAGLPPPATSIASSEKQAPSRDGPGRTQVLPSAVWSWRHSQSRGSNGPAGAPGRARPRMHTQNSHGRRHRVQRPRNLGFC